jgi:predicted DNA-binding transcriptional regulator YafY
MSKKSRAKRRSSVAKAKEDKGQDLWAHGYGRAALERMMRIHRLIEERDYPNCTKMSVEFEVSVRTLKRDIEFMKDSLKMPIDFDVPKNGYFFTRPMPNFPRVPMSEKDVWTLFVAQKAIAQYQGTALQQVLEAGFRKLVGQLDESVRFSFGSMDGAISFRPFAPGDAELETFKLLTDAVSGQSAVRFTYRNRGELKTEERHVYPYHIAYVDNKWTLFGFDVRRKAIRKFVLVRLTKPELTGERFEVSEAFDLNKELSGSLGLYKGEGDYEVVVEFDRWGADDVRGKTWHSSQELTELPQGRLRVRLRLNSLEEVSRWVLGFEDHATVVGPKELRERVGRINRELAERYGA